MTLTFPFIDDVAPARHKTLWFGCLGLAQPVNHLERGLWEIGDVILCPRGRDGYVVEVFGGVARSVLSFQHQVRVFPHPPAF